MTVNHIQTFDSFLKIINSRNEIIAYPVGNEGNVFLRFLEYHNLINYFCCVAAREVREDVVQSFVNSLPVIPINCLQHFRNSAVIIVSAPSEYHQAINNELSEFGFKDIVFISREMHEQVANALKQLSNSAYTLIWSMNKIMDRITDLERNLDGQNQIRDVHKETFSRYRNSFLGKKIVIVGGGPSAKFYSPIKDAIHIGINFAWQREDIIFDYLFTQDRWQNYLSGLKMEDGFDRIKHKIFVGKCIDSYPRPNYPENVSIKRNNVLRYYLDESPLSHVIHQDICYHPIRCFGSTSFAALSFALFTYPKEIYLVGFDTSSPGKHFYSHPDPKYDETGKNSTPSLTVMKVGYAKIKMFAKQYYPDVDIISINPVGLKGLFKDLYTEEFNQESKGGYDALIFACNTNTLEGRLNNVVLSPILGLGKAA